MESTVDLSLIPFDDLIAECEKRTTTFICAARFDCADEKDRELKFKYGRGNWIDAVGLAAVLGNDVINNWPRDDDGN